MTDTNLPVLYRNVLESLPCETAQKAFLWAADGHDGTRFKYPAEKYAREVKTLLEFLRPMLGKAFAMRAWCTDNVFNASESVMDDLERFILKRHANDRWGGNVSMWWEDK